MLPFEKPNQITFIGETDFRGEHKPFGIRRTDRRSHMYLIGKTGTGKSTLIRTLIQQDIANGEGCALIDPHGDLVEQVYQVIPAHRRSDFIYFNVPDTKNPLAFNPLELKRPEDAALVASGLISVLKKIWAEFWGPRMEYILRNALLTALEVPGSTLTDVARLLSDPKYRENIIGNLSNGEVRSFWVREFAGYSAHFRAEATAPIQNKIGEFLVNPTIRRIVEQPKSTFDLSEVMQQRKILLVNLAKGQVGEDTAALLGGMLVSKFALAALSRAAITEDERRDFYLYVDEFPSFTSSSFASMLSEARKYRLCLTLTHQHLSQLDEQTRDAILGNVGTMVVFRVGSEDAEVLAKDFADLREQDLIALPNHHAYVKLMIDGVVSSPFSAKTRSAILVSAITRDLLAKNIFRNRHKQSDKWQSRENGDDVVS